MPPMVPKFPFHMTIGAAWPVHAIIIIIKTALDRLYLVVKLLTNSNDCIYALNSNICLFNTALMKFQDLQIVINSLHIDEEPPGYARICGCDIFEALCCMV